MTCVDYIYEIPPPWGTKYAIPSYIDPHNPACFPQNATPTAGRALGQTPCIAAGNAITTSICGQGPPPAKPQEQTDWMLPVAIIGGVGLLAFYLAR